MWCSFFGVCLFVLHYHNKMRESTKQKLYELLYDELKENITLDGFTSCDVWYNTKRYSYMLMTSFYTEAAEQINFDPDLPPEYKDLYVSCHWWSLVRTDESGNEKYFDKEAQEIVLRVLNQITKQ